MRGRERWASRRSAAARRTPGFWSATAARWTPSARTWRRWVERRATILAGKVLVPLERCPAGIVFLDPPYGLEDEYTGALQLLGMKPPVLAIAQHSVHLKLKDAYGGLHRTRMVKHGDNALSFYAAAG